MNNVFEGIKENKAIKISSSTLRRIVERVINEQDEDYLAITDTEETDDEAIDSIEEVVGDEITDEEIADVPDDEDSWLEERWEDLTDAVKNIFSRRRPFAGCRTTTPCPDFNKVSRRRKKRILRSISLAWPRIKWPRFVIRWPRIRFRKRT